MDEGGAEVEVEREEKIALPRRLFESVFKNKAELEHVWTEIQPFWENLGKVDGGRTTFHCRGVAGIARSFAEYLGIEGEELDRIELIGWLHDLAKGIKENGGFKYGPILNSSEKLTNEQKDFIAPHPTEGADMLRILGFPDDMITAVEDHHKKGEGVLKSRSSQVIMLADVLESLTSTKRRYREASSKPDAFERVRNDFLGRVESEQVRGKFIEWRNEFVNGGNVKGMNIKEPANTVH